MMPCCNAVSASHLSEEKNGIKFFSRAGGLSKSNIDELVILAQDEARRWYDMGILPPLLATHEFYAPNWSVLLLSQLLSIDVSLLVSHPMRPFKQSTG